VQISTSTKENLIRVSCKRAPLCKSQYTNKDKTAIYSHDRDICICACLSMVTTKKIVRKRAHMGRIWMRCGAIRTGRHAPWSLSWSRNSKRPNEYRCCQFSKALTSKYSAWIAVRTFIFLRTFTSFSTATTMVFFTKGIRFKHCLHCASALCRSHTRPNRKPAKRSKRFNSNRQNSGKRCLRINCHANRPDAEAVLVVRLR
jgi:hypothetical protein